MSALAALDAITGLPADVASFYCSRDGWLIAVRASEPFGAGGHTHQGWGATATAAYAAAHREKDRADRRYGFTLAIAA